MTICAGALAGGGTSLVCVADKAISYGDYIQWDGDSTKIITLPSNQVVSMSGHGAHIDRVIKKLEENLDFGRSIRTAITFCENAYQEARDEFIDFQLLRTNLLTRDEYLGALTAPNVSEIITELSGQIRSFQMSCSLLVAGFDEQDKPFLLHLDEPGNAVDMTWEGFHAVGSGFDKAIARLLFAEYKREHSVERVLYEMFDAKAAAEMAVGVGYEWDAVILAKRRRFDVPKEIKELIEKVWAKANRSPFEERKKDDIDPPPKHWRRLLSDYVEGLSPEPHIG